MNMEKGDYFIITKEKEEKYDMFADFVADTPEERIKLLLIEAMIASWARSGSVSDKDAKIYFHMLYDELKKIRERKLKIVKSSDS